MTGPTTFDAMLVAEMDLNVPLVSLETLRAHIVTRRLVPGVAYQCV